MKAQNWNNRMNQHVRLSVEQVAQNIPAAESFSGRLSKMISLDKEESPYTPRNLTVP